jgi:hypothetical protein
MQCMITISHNGHWDLPMHMYDTVEQGYGIWPTVTFCINLRRHADIPQLNTYEIIHHMASGAILGAHAPLYCVIELVNGK